MSNNWTVVEFSGDPWTGGDILPVSGAVFSTSTGGANCFYLDHNPTSVVENNNSTIKEFETVDGEMIRINIFRPADLTGGTKRKTAFDIKIEFQTFQTFANLKFLFNNGKKFYLYNTDPAVNTTATRLFLAIDDFTVDWVALQGTKQIYGITLKCRDILTDSSGSPIKWRFEENVSRSPWIWTVDTGNGGGALGGNKFFTSDFSASSAAESFKKRSNDVETINGTIVRINAIRIAPNGSIEKTPGVKNINIKFDYQSESFKKNILSLYNSSNEFQVYGDNSHVNSPGNSIGLYVIDDYSVEYMAVRDTSRLYGVTVVLREVEISS